MTKLILKLKEAKEQVAPSNKGKDIYDLDILSEFLTPEQIQEIDNFQDKIYNLLVKGMIDLEGLLNILPLYNTFILLRKPIGKFRANKLRKVRENKIEGLM